MYLIFRGQTKSLTYIVVHKADKKNWSVHKAPIYQWAISLQNKFLVTIWKYYEQESFN